MRQSMWRLLLSSTVDDQLVDVRQIRALTSDTAIRRAIDLLGAARLNKPGGNRWDRWHLAAKNPATGRWQVLFQGTHEGLTPLDPPPGVARRLDGQE